MSKSKKKIKILQKDFTYIATYSITDRIDVLNIRENLFLS